jgi:hypothetical protein
MSDAYLAWSHAVAEERGLPSEYSLPEDAVVQERRLITVVDIFCKSFPCFAKSSYIN